MFGQYGVVSFNGNKIITTSGGMLLTEEKTALDKAFFCSSQARENVIWFQHNGISYSYRMSNVVAGVGRGQMKHLKERRYEEAFKDLLVMMNPVCRG
ncbi:MAG: DegT/DnrJ/EryC1/StrS family aminotransferase [Clostridia bacterium]|nr:DegT/DnrJ/EryC1/StrS family aminotransferase [Clostridia bacterium]